MSYHHNVKLFVFVLSVFANINCLAKVYRISDNGISFENQLYRILSVINDIPGNENITVKIENGYYVITKTINIVTGNHKINFIGSKKNPPIISGSIAIKKWEILPDGTWRGCIPYKVTKETIPHQLYVNGVRAKRSRIPNVGVFFLKDGIKKGLSYGAVLQHDNVESIPTICKNEIPLISVYQRWVASKCHILKTSSSKDTIFYLGKEFPVHNQLRKGNGIIIENTRGGIDEPGEWCVDNKGNIYYYPMEGERIEKCEFRIPVVEKLIAINSFSSNMSGIKFKNIIFEHTSYSIPLGGTDFGQAAASMSAAIEADNVENLIFEDCEIRNTANYGIWMRTNCQKSTISRTYFHDLGAGAIKIGALNQIKDDFTNLTSHICIDNNIISRYGELMESAVGIILFNAADCKITHNDIHYGNYTGVSLGWMWSYNYSPSKRNEVSYNRISHIGTGLLRDLGGIYTLGKSEGTHIHHNVISDIFSPYDEGWGIYADEGSSGILVDKNLVYRTASGGFHQHYGTGNVVSNNIFAWGNSCQISLSVVNAENPLFFSNNIIIMDTGLLMSGNAITNNKVFFKRNCYWKISNGLPKIKEIDIQTWINQRDTTSVYTNPLFKDPLNGNFCFKESTAIHQIDFKKFDYTSAGVYGKKKWKFLGENSQIRQ